MNLDRLRMGPRPGRKSEPPPRHGRGEWFLKGPIPWAWLARALSLPGKALHVGVVLWFRAGLEQSRTIALSMTRFEEVGVSRFSASRGLRRLKKARLVKVKAGKGRKPRVTIVHNPKETPSPKEST